MAENSKEPDDHIPDDHVAVQTQPGDYYQKILEAFSGVEIQCKGFQTIPRGIFPTNFGRNTDYENLSLFIVLFDPKKTNAGLLREALEELSQTVYPLGKPRYPVFIKRKRVSHSDWQKFETVYQAAFGSTEDKSLNQVIFCDEISFSKFTDNFQGLYFIRK